MTDVRSDQIQITQMILLVTNKCNLWCKMCDYRMIRMGCPELSPAEILKIINEAYLQGLQHLELSGGEPMMRSDIYEIITYSHNLGIDTVMTTNGTLIGESEAARLAQAGLNILAVSIEGFQELNDRLRGAGVYQKALNAMAALRKQPDFTGRIQVAVTISGLNYLRLFEFTRFLLEEIGADTITFHPFTEAMMHPQKRNLFSDYMITGSQLPGLKEQLMMIQEYSRNHRDSFQNAAYFQRMIDYFNGQLSPPASGCGKPRTECCVDASGMVYPCPMCNEFAGNSIKVPFWQIITGHKYRNFCTKALQSLCPGCLNGE